MSPGTPTQVRRRLGEVLVEQGAVTPEQLDEALEAQRAAQREQRRVRLGTLIVELGLATERQVATALAAALALEVVDLSTITLDASVARLLPRSVAERYLVLPIKRTDTGQIVVACADPTNVVAIDDVKVHVGVAQLKLVVAPESQLRDLLTRTWSLSEDSADVAMLLEDLEDSFEEDNEGTEGDTDAPTVRLVNTMLADAVRARASDIHVEPQQSTVRIRYRVDGLLRDVMTVPRAAAPGLISRIKVMSNLDIAERRVPQDGRTRLQVDGSLLDARVSTLPNIHGEKVVIRLLSRADSVPPITKMGLDEQQLEALLAKLVTPQGLILITGPTGSGKTSTLYSAIHQIKTVERNIVTLEDPVEMQVQGITQVQVHDRAGMTFARGLRSVLRQDPDVVLVGEVRDQETANLALEASLTGHLVLTTLHTNSAPAAITRLVDMGVEPFLVASSLSLVVAQRLVRRVCEACVAPYTPPQHVLTLLGIEAGDLAGSTPMRGTGCPDCGNTGYRGRLGVFEVLPITAAMRAVLMSTPNEGAVAAAARAAGMQTLRSAALLKAHAGLTTYEEVLRVTQVDSGSTALRCTACSAPLAADMVICPLCATTVDRGHCEHCDRALEAAWKVCPWCKTAAPVRGGASGAHGAAPARARVLVVEDNPSVRDYICATLHDAVDVDAFGTASEALDQVMTGAYDGVVVDHQLPDLTGVDMIRMLRSEARTAALPVMMLSGSDTGDLETEARNAGADEYLTKPVEPAALVERVLELVQRSARFAT